MISYLSACEAYLRWAECYWKENASKEVKEVREKLLSKVYRVMKTGAFISEKYLTVVVANPCDYTAANLLKECSILPGYQFSDELIQEGGETAYIIWATPKAEK